MSFREKSAWVMSAVLLLAGAAYLKFVIVDGVPPFLAAVPFVLLVVAGSIAAQVILAIASPREAMSAADERERIVADRSAHFSSYVLVVGVLLGLSAFAWSQDGMNLFHTVLVCLILSQIAEYAAQIFMLRRSV